MYEPFVGASFVVKIACGEDRVTGKNFSHRKQWLEDELLRLSGEVLDVPVVSPAYLVREGMKVERHKEKIIGFRAHCCV